jgi:hypothetical protein
MRLKQLAHKRIDVLAQKKLSHLQASTLPVEIIKCIDYFRTNLEEDDIINDDIKNQKITHSNKVCMNWKSYVQAENILRFSSRYLGAEYCYVKNQKSGDGIIFIGQVNNIYATQVVFDCLQKIATEIRHIYLQKLNRYKKQSTKEQRVNEYMDEWFDGMKEHLQRGTWYDPWRLYTSSDRKYFADYVKQHFKMWEDTRKLFLLATEILKPLFALIEGTITAEEFRQAKEEGFKTFPKALIKQTGKELCEINSKDLVMDFSVEEDSDLEESMD